MRTRFFGAGLAVLTLAHLAGCQKILGFEDHTVSDTGGAASAAAAGATGGDAALGGSGAQAGKGGSGTGGTGGTSGGNTGGASANGGSGNGSGTTGGDAGDASSGATGGNVGQGGSGTGGDGTGGVNGGTGGTGGTGGGSSGDAGAGDNGGTGGSSSGGSAGMGGSAGVGGTVALPPPIGENMGTQGHATRYWDCCKPTSAWINNVPDGVTPMPACSLNDTVLASSATAPSACDGGGPAYMCWSATPWALSDALAYGFAAGPDGTASGECYQVEFYSSSHGVVANAGNSLLAGKTMIVQIVTENQLADSQLDLLIPGGGVGQYTACSAQWGTSNSNLGYQYGGFLSTCAESALPHDDVLACVANKCASVFVDKQELLDGCDWFVTWFHGAEIPELQYQHIACPTELTDRSGLADTWVSTK